MIDTKLDQHWFVAGLNNLPSGHFMSAREGGFPVPYPARWHVYFEDFDHYDAQDWVLTTVEAGAGSAAEVITDEDGGVLLITNDAADDDSDFYQTTGEIFTLVAGKKCFFEAKFKVSDATQSDFVMGLQVRDTTPLAVSAGVYFQKDDGDALLDFHNMVASVDTALTGIATVVAATYLTVAFFWDGVSTITVAVNNTVVGTMTSTPSTTELTVSFGIQNGEAVAKTMSVDYILVARER